MKIAQWVVLVLLFLVWAGAAASASLIRVPAHQPTIQAGIDAAADGDLVLVADGTYSGPGNYQINFHGKAIRVQSERGPFTCTIDLQNTHFGFIFDNGEGGDSVLSGFTITNGFSGTDGGAVLCSFSSPWLRGNRFIDNLALQDGGAIACITSDPSITNNYFYHNEARDYGGAVSCIQGSSPTLNGNKFKSNESYYGGGLCVLDSSETLVIQCAFEGNSAVQGGALHSTGNISHIRLFHCLIRNNSSSWGGAILAINNGEVSISNCLINGNQADVSGGAIYSASGDVYAELATLADNRANYGGAIFVNGGVPVLRNSIVWGNLTETGDEIQFASGSISFDYSCVTGGWPGTGNIGEDPLFVFGPMSGHYLSQTAAGQPAQSPCANAADPSISMQHYTTRTDHENDTGRADMGYHPGLSRLAIGAGPGSLNPPRVRIFSPEDDGPQMVHQFDAYGVPRFGVNVACGEFSIDNGLGTDEIITGPGPGAVFGPHVRGFHADGTPLPGLSFLAYGTNKYGVNVAAGELFAGAIGPGVIHEIITGAGPGKVFGPHVRAFFYNEAEQTVSALPEVSYFAYGTNKYGVNVAAGNIDGDNYDEIITGPGPGAIFGPHVRGWNVDGNPVTPIPGVSFLAYGTNKYGVNVTCGDVDGDGMDEIITAPGPGSTFGAHIRGWNYDGAMVTQVPGLSFFAWPPGQVRYGARIDAGMDIYADGKDEIVVGCGPDPGAGSPVNVYTYMDGDEGMRLLFSFNAFPSSFDHGTTVTAGRF